MKRLFLTLISAPICFSAAFCQHGGNNDCAILKKYKLQYLSLKDTSAYIMLSDDSAVEYHNQGRYKLTAKIEWVSDCEYNMILSSVTIPEFLYHPGDVMNVRVDKIEQDIVYYFSTINGNGWEGKLRVVK